MSDPVAILIGVLVGFVAYPVLRALLKKLLDRIG